MLTLGIILSGPALAYGLAHSVVAKYRGHAQTMPAPAPQGPPRCHRCGAEPGPGETVTELTDVDQGPTVAVAWHCQCGCIPVVRRAA